MFAHWVIRAPGVIVLETGGGVSRALVGTWFLPRCFEPQERKP